MLFAIAEPASDVGVLNRTNRKRVVRVQGLQTETTTQCVSSLTRLQPTVKLSNSSGIRAQVGNSLPATGADTGVSEAAVTRYMFGFVHRLFLVVL